MMNKDIHKTSLKESFDNYSPQPPEMVWEKVEKKLLWVNTVIFFRKNAYLLLLLLFVGIVSLFTFLSNSEEKKSQFVNDPDSQSSIEITVPSPEMRKEKNQTKKNDTFAKNVEVPITKKSSTTKEIDKEEKTKIPKKIQTLTNNTNKITQDSKHNTEPDTVIIAQKEKLKQNNTSSNIFFSPLNIKGFKNFSYRNKILFAQREIDINSSLKLTKRKNKGFNLNTYLAYSVYIQGQTVILPEEDKPKNEVGTGLSIIFDKPNYFIELGLNYNYANDKSDYIMNYNYIDSIGSYRKPNGYRIDESTGLPIFEYVDETIMDTLSYTQQEETKQHYNAISTNIFAGYKIYENKRLQTYLQSGIVFSKILSQYKGEGIQPEKSEIVQIEVKDRSLNRTINNYYFSLGASFRFQLSPKISLRFDPLYTRYFNAPYEQYNSKKSYAISAKFGLIWFPNK